MVGRIAREKERAAMQAGSTSLNIQPLDGSSRNHARGGFQKLRNARTRRLN